MSMAISSSQTQTSAIQPYERTSPAKASNSDVEKTDKKESPRFDEYVHSEDKAEAAGIYSPSTDEEGNPKIAFDNPEKQKDNSIPEKADGPADEEDPKTTQCTVDTGKVDAEIKNLQEKQQSIQQKLSRLPEGSEERAALEKQLSSVDAELKVKDNDTYRKQNSSYTNSDME